MVLKNFVFEENMVADIVSEPDGEGYIVDLKSPWGLYIEDACDYNIENLCIYTLMDFTDICIMIGDGDCVKCIDWKPTVSDMKMLKKMLETKL